MRRSVKLDGQIAMLVLQLPRQRLQLSAQTHAVVQAVRSKLSSPAALAVATAGGVLIGWGLYRQDSPTSVSNATDNPKLSVAAWLRRGLWAGFMAYLVRKTV
ncbi:hypothetical protein [Bowmanella dokdonensis]|uniref:Uncharacterized protein n=1 Tax=Bowmanella dokdonensis TaxID=751969 RepID=A0A939DR77_9ALTE|nr:hypothetical protein [Bowmanella dokdonensis]MBN7826406.1 hypothetical protein [Bowmanella dokdonensis]